MVGPMPALMLGDRVNTVVELGRNEADALRGIVADVRTRFDLSAGSKEPSAGRGVLGQRGSLAKEPIVFATKTLDGVFAFVQANASINRRQIR